TRGACSGWRAPREPRYLSQPRTGAHTFIRDAATGDRAPQETGVSPTHIHTTDAPAAIGPYSQGIVANGFLFTAGQIALDPASGEIVPGGVREQTERVMRNLSAVLAKAGTGWNHVVK